MGALDDRFDISVKIRALVQAAVAIVMMVGAKLYLLSLGFIIGPVELVVGPFGYVLTLFAVWAAINAFNMVDGIDGLLGGLASVTFAAMGIILYFDGQTSLAMWCFAMIAATIPYILLNLGLIGRRYKVFMGDAGSTMIGFTIIWILLETTQGLSHPITPVTALWLIAIPLMDMVAIMYRRLRKDESVLSGPPAHSPFDHACRFHFASGLCADYRGCSAVGRYWCAGRIPCLHPRVGDAGAVPDGLFPLRLLPETCLACGAQNPSY